MADRTVNYSFTGNFTNLTAGLTAASKSVQDFGSKLTALDANGAKMRAGLDHMGRVGGRVALGLGAGLAATAKAAMDWETAWTGVLKTVDATANTSLGALEDQLRGLARELPASHQEIAAVAEAAGQLGISADNVTDFTRTMIALGETTSLSAEEAATSIARFTNIMGTAQSDVDRVGASMVALGNNFATTESEIITLGQRMAAAGAIAGLSEADVLGFAASLTSVGVEAEAGGTAMSKVFTSMRDAVIDGGDKLETFATTAGVTAEEFAAQWEGSPAQAINMFIQGLGALNAQGQSTSAVFKALGLTDQRLMRALLSTAEAGDMLTESLEMSGDAWQENTALTDEFAKFLGTTSSEVRVAWNNIKDAAIETGQVMLPIVSGVAERVADMAKAFGDLPRPVQSATAGLAGLTALLGGGVWFGSKVVGGIVDTRKALADLGTSAPKAERALRGVMKAGLAMAALEGAGMIFDSIRDSAAGAAPEVEKLTAALIDANMAQFASEFGGTFREALDALDTDKVTGFALAVRDVAGVVPGGEAAVSSLASALGPLGANMAAADVQTKAATQAFEAADDALTGLVSGAGAERAEEMFRSLAAAEGLTAAETERIMGLLPNFSAALQGAANDAKLAGEGASEAGAGAQEAAAGFDAAASAAERMESAMKGLAGWLSHRKAMRDFNEAVQDLTKSLEDGFQEKDAERIDAVAQGILDVYESLDGKEIKQENFLRRTRDLLEGIAENAGPAARSEINEMLEHLNRIEPKLTDLANMAIQPTLDLFTAPFDSKLPARKKDLSELGNSAARPTADLIDNAFRDAFGGAKRSMRDLDNDKANPKAGLEDGVFVSRSGKARSILEYLDRAKSNPTVGLNDNASGPLANIRSMLAAINGTAATASVTITRVTRNMFGGGPADGGTLAGGMWFRDGQWHGAADGNTVPKTGLPYADRHLYLLADGEEVISNRYGQADRHRDLLKAINANKLADGGTTGRARSTFSPAFDFRGAGLVEVVRYLDLLDDGLKGLGKKDLKIREKDIERTEKQLEKWSEAREDLAKKQVEADRERLKTMREAHRAFAEQVGNLFRADVFAAPPPIELPENWWSMSDAEKTAWHAEQERKQALQSTDALRANIFELERAQALHQALRDRGLTGPAFRELVSQAGVDQLQAYMHLSGDELKRLTQLYAQRERMVAQTGTAVADAEFGRGIGKLEGRLRESVSELREIKQENRQLKREVQGIRRELDDVAKKVGKAVGKEVSGAAVRGAKGKSS